MSQRKSLSITLVVAGNGLAILTAVFLWSGETRWADGPPSGHARGDAVLARLGVCLKGGSVLTHLLFAVSTVLAIVVLGVGWRFWPALRPPIPIVVLAGDWRRRVGVRRDLAATVRRLGRVASGADFALLVVDRLPDGQRAVCSSVRRHADGRLIHLVSLALSVPEHRLAPDEVLAALAEQYLALADAAQPRRRRVPASPPPAADQVGAFLRDLSVSQNGHGD